MPILTDVPNEESASDGDNDPSTSRADDSEPLRRSTRHRGAVELDSSEKEDNTKAPVKFTVNGVEYWTLEYVYYEVPNEPYYAIAYVEELVDRDKEKIHIRRFFHTFDVPEDSKNILDRKIKADPSNDEKVRAILDREIFNSDNISTIEGKQLRGKCFVKSFVQLSDALDNFDPTNSDCFFNAYCFKAETKQVIPNSPRIKIGHEYQVNNLPIFRGDNPRGQICPIHGVINHHHYLRKRRNAISANDSSGALVPVGLKRSHSPAEERRRRVWEELVWDPEVFEENFEGGELDDRFEMFMLMASSTIATSCIGGGSTDQESLENSKAFVESMATKQHIHDILHNCDYDCQRALEKVFSNPVSATNTPMHWTVDQVKQFATALKQVGRNFFLIQKRYFSATTSIDPIEGSATRYPPRYPRGRKRRRLAGDDPSNSNNQQQEESEGNGEALDNPNNEDGEENVLEPVDEEVPDSPQAEEPDDNYLFMPTKEKSVKELIEFFHFWKKKKAQSTMCFTNIRSPALTNDADDKKLETGKSKKSKKFLKLRARQADPDPPAAADGGKEPSDKSDSAYSGPCKFCHYGLVGSQTMETTLKIPRKVNFHQACSSCQLHYLKYCYLPGTRNTVLLSPTEPNIKAESPSPKPEEAEPCSECFCAVSPTYASCLSSPEQSLNGYEEDGPEKKEPEEVKVELMEIAKETREVVKSSIQQSNPPIVSSGVDTKAETKNEVCSAEQSRELEASLPHQAIVSQPNTADNEKLAPKSTDSCTGSSVPIRISSEQTSDPAKKLSRENETFVGISGLERLPEIFRARNIPPDQIELIKHNLTDIFGGSSGNRPPSMSNLSSATSQPTMTSSARGTFYPPTGVLPSSSNSTQQQQLHRGQNQSGASSTNPRQQSFATVRTPASNLSSSRPQYPPPLQQPMAPPLSPPSQNRNVLPEHAVQFLRDQQFDAQRPAQSMSSASSLTHQQPTQQYAALSPTDAFNILSHHFKNPVMEACNRSMLQRAEIPPEMLYSTLLEFYKRVLLSNQIRRPSTAVGNGGSGDNNFRVTQGPSFPQQQQQHSRQPTPTIPSYQHPTMNPASSTTRENAFYNQQRSIQQQQGQNPAPPPPVESCQRGAPVFYPRLPTPQQLQQQQQQILPQRSAQSQPQQHPQQSRQQQSQLLSSLSSISSNQQLSNFNELIQRHLSLTASGVALSPALAPNVPPTGHPGMAHQQVGNSSGQQSHPQSNTNLSWMQHFLLLPPQQQELFLQYVMRHNQQQQGGSGGNR